MPHDLHDETQAKTPKKLKFYRIHAPSPGGYGDAVTWISCEICAPETWDDCVGHCTREPGYYAEKTQLTQEQINAHHYTICMTCGRVASRVTSQP